MSAGSEPIYDEQSDKCASALGAIILSGIRDVDSFADYLKGYDPEMLEYFKKDDASWAMLTNLVEYAKRIA